MLCKNCKKREATVYYKQNINGKVTETALCDECAEKLHFSDSVFSFGGLLGSLFGGESALESEKVCSLCGSTLRDLRRTGKAGCPKCYEVFRDELTETVAGIHGAREHTGRGPHGYKLKNDRRSQLKELKTKMKEAVRDQNFEEAAALRDQIRSLEEEN